MNRFFALLLLAGAAATLTPANSIAQTSAPAESSSDFGLGSSNPPPHVADTDVVVQVCVSKDGTIDKVTLLKGTGDAAADQKVIAGLKAMPSLKPPPADMPPCMTLKIKHGTQITSP